MNVQNISLYISLLSSGAYYFSLADPRCYGNEFLGQI